jgi:drug/metabolite transporter (DMT)-like permease
VLKNHRGEFYLFMGAFVFSLNGIVSTVVLEHMSAFRLAQIRAIGAFTILFIYALIKRRELLAIKRSQIKLLITYGIIGFASVNVGYFLGIERGLPLGMVLILEFTAPIWVVLWIKYVRRGFVAQQMWIAIALALVGLILVAKVWDGFTFDLIGAGGALFSAFALTGYFLIGKDVTAERPPLSATIIGLGVAAAFWALVLPLWSYPTEIFTTRMDIHGYLAGHYFPGWALIAYIIIMGTIVPYIFVISGLSILSASKSSVMGMLEPVLASVFAWIWLGQSWDVIQLLGAVIVLIGVYLADSAKATA